MIGYDGSSKTNLKLIEKGCGGLDVVGAKLTEVSTANGGALFGGVRILTGPKTGRFVHFVYVDEDTCPAMKKGRTLMYKNGVFNALQGCDGEIEICANITEASIGPIR